MISKCSYCNKINKIKTIKKIVYRPFLAKTHGICRKCFRRIICEIKATVKELNKEEKMTEKELKYLSSARRSWFSEEQID